MLLESSVPSNSWNNALRAGHATFGYRKKRESHLQDHSCLKTTETLRSAMIGSELPVWC